MRHSLNLCPCLQLLLSMNTGISLYMPEEHSHYLAIEFAIQTVDKLMRLRKAVHASAAQAS